MPSMTALWRVGRLAARLGALVRTLRRSARAPRRRMLAPAVFEALLAETLAVRGVLEAEPSADVTIWLDADHRPDVADLFRVHAVEGTGVVGSDWVFTPETEPPRVFFRCTLSAPVRTEFSFSLVLPGDHGRALADAETALAATRRPSSPSATGPRR